MGSRERPRISRHATALRLPRRAPQHKGAPSSWLSQGDAPPSCACDRRGNAAAPPSMVRTALRRGSMRRGHLLGEVPATLVRYPCVDHIAVDHRLVEQLVCDLA